MKTRFSFNFFLNSSVIFILTIGLGAVPLRAAAQEEMVEFPQENAWTRVTPSVVWCGDPETPVTIEVHIVGREDVARVWVTNLENAPGEGDAELFDDGSHGDLAGGDKVFTLGGIVLPCTPGYTFDKGWKNWWGFLRVELTDGSRQGNNYGLVAGLVEPEFKDQFSVHDFGNGLSATAYAFFIVDISHEVMDSYPVANVYCGTANYAAYQKLYSVLPDFFDFALVMPGMQIFRPRDLAENVPYDFRVSNHVQNIGMDIFDKSALFGSAGMLKSGVFHSFGGIDIAVHEIGHTWGMDLGASLGLMQDWQGSPLLGHWNPLADVQGQMGAYYFGENGEIGHFAYNGDGTWHLIPNTAEEPYSPLELYAMGMIPPEQVPPIHILHDPDLSDPQHITAASYQTVTIDQIMAAEGGARIPAAAESQKNFNLAFIVTQDVPYTDAAYAYFSLISHQLMSQEPPTEAVRVGSFYWATGGLGTLNTLLPVDSFRPAWLPGDPTLEPTPAPPDNPTPLPIPSNTPLKPQPTDGETSGKPLCGGTAALALLPALLFLLRKRQ